MRTLFFIVTISLAVLSCDACKPTTGGRAADAPAARSADVFPFYRFWTSEQLPDGPPPAPDGLTDPAASAVLVATGYLLAPIEGMGSIADDPGADPTVHLAVGGRWLRGRYVDRDHDLRLALIRADVPGKPVPLGKGPGPAVIVSFPSDGSGSSTHPATACDERAERSVDAARLGFLICVEGRAGELPGGVFLDRDGSIAGLQVARSGSPARFGPDAARIRDYLDTYFASWGSAVRPKPAY